MFFFHQPIQESVYICRVKKMMVFFFMLVFLCANTAFGQVLRLPVLVHHYLEHCDQNNLSLADFLNEHYVGSIQHPDDRHHDHEHLPFKTDGHAVQLVITAPASAFTFSKITYVASEAVRTDGDSQFQSNAYLNSIWQPPRLS